MPSSEDKHTTKRAYMRAYMRAYNQTHPERYVAFKRRQVLRYAMLNNRVPTKRSIARYGLTCEELGPIFLALINSEPCCAKCKR